MAIMEKVERWMLARDEERWLEEYSMVNFLTHWSMWFIGSNSLLYYIMFYISSMFQDETRYSVSRGAHKNLRRAERARVIVNKIPGKRGKLLKLQELPQKVISNKIAFSNNKKKIVASITHPKTTHLSSLKRSPGAQTLNFRTWRTAEICINHSESNSNMHYQPIRLLGRWVGNNLPNQGVGSGSLLQ